MRGAGNVTCLLPTPPLSVGCLGSFYFDGGEERDKKREKKKKAKGNRRGKYKVVATGRD